MLVYFSRGGGGMLTGLTADFSPATDKSSVPDKEEEKSHGESVTTKSNKKGGKNEAVSPATATAAAAAVCSSSSKNSSQPPEEWGSVAQLGLPSTCAALQLGWDWLHYLITLVSFIIQIRHSLTLFSLHNGSVLLQWYSGLALGYASQGSRVWIPVIRWPLLIFWNHSRSQHI